MIKQILFLSIVLGSVFVTNAEEIPNIHESYGKINDYFDQGSDQTVYLIQDVHCFYESQINGRGVYQNLYRNEGVKDLFLEGAYGEMDLLKLEQFSDQDANQKIADNFLKEGLLTGPEYFAIIDHNDVRLYGIENREKYLANLESFKNAYPFMSSWTSKFQDLFSALEQCKTNLYSGLWKEIDRLIQDYHQGIIKFDDYLKQLIALLDAQSIDWNQYPNLALQKKVWNLMDAIKMNRLDKTRNDLFKKIMNSATQNEKDVWTTEMLTWVHYENSSYYFYKKLLDAAKSIDYRENIMELEKYYKMLASAYDISEPKLYQELDQLLNQVFTQVVSDSSSHKLYATEKDLYRLFNLTHLRISNQDLNYLLKNPKALDLDSIIRNLNEVRAMEALEAISIDLELWQDAQAAFMQFYKEARGRENDFLTNILEQMKKKNLKKSVLVTGGFHTDMLTQQLKERNINYYVITPKILNPLARSRYFDVLIGNTEYVGAGVPVLLNTPLATFSDPLRESSQETLRSRWAIQQAALAVKMGKPVPEASTAEWKPGQRVLIDGYKLREDGRVELSVHVVNQSYSKDWPATGYYEAYVAAPNEKVQDLADSLKAKGHVVSVIEDQNMVIIEDTVKGLQNILRNDLLSKQDLPDIEKVLKDAVTSETVQTALNHLKILFESAVAMEDFEKVAVLSQRLWDQVDGKEILNQPELRALKQFKDMIHFQALAARKDEYVNRYRFNREVAIGEQRAVIIDLSSLFSIKIDPDTARASFMPYLVNAAMALRNLRAQSKGNVKFIFVSLEDGVNEDIIREQLLRIGIGADLQDAILGSDEILNQFRTAEAPMVETIIKLAKEKNPEVKVSSENVRVFADAESAWKDYIEKFVISFTGELEAEGDLTSPFNMALLVEVSRMIGQDPSPELIAYLEEKYRGQKIDVRGILVGTNNNYPKPVMPDILDEIGTSLDLESDVDIAV